MTSSLQHDNPEDYRYWPVELQVQHVQRAQEQVALGLPKFDAIFANAAGACENPCPELKALYGLFSGFCAELRQEPCVSDGLVHPTPDVVDVARVAILFQS